MDLGCSFVMQQLHKSAFESRLCCLLSQVVTSLLFQNAAECKAGEMRTSTFKFLSNRSGTHSLREGMSL